MAVRLFLLVVSPVVFVLLLEGVLWMCAYGRPTAYLLRSPATGDWYRNEKFTWQFAPPRIAPIGSQLQISDVKPPGTFRIFILGESAAMGTPDGSYSFGRIVECMLRARHPGRKIEVHIAATTAINSHVLLSMARECANRQPGLFILTSATTRSPAPSGHRGCSSRARPTSA